VEEFVFVADESGAKGYSDKSEAYVGEVGVMAGFIISEKHLQDVQANLDLIKDRYFIDGKVHITDIYPKNQQQLRNDIFLFILQRQIICVYEAIHSEGFFQNSQFLKSLTQRAIENSKSKVKISKHERKELLHERLFQGVFGKAVAFCMDCVEEQFSILVRTDQIDNSIKTRFNEVASELLNFGKEKVRKVTGYDPDKKQVVRREIRSSISNASKLLGDFSKVCFFIDCEDSSLTLAADIIANSIHYHLKSRPAEEKGKHLNTKDAIAGHPLEKVFYGLCEDKELNYFADAVFMHPKAKDNEST